jgi:hypothetical protein
VCSSINKKRPSRSITAATVVLGFQRSDKDMGLTLGINLSTHADGFVCAISFTNMRLQSSHAQAGGFGRSAKPEQSGYLPRRRADPAGCETVKLM